MSDIFQITLTTQTGDTFKGKRGLDLRLSW